MPVYFRINAGCSSFVWMLSAAVMRTPYKWKSYYFIAFALLIYCISHLLAIASVHAYAHKHIVFAHEIFRLLTSCWKTQTLPALIMFHSICTPLNNDHAHFYAESGSRLWAQRESMLSRIHSPSRQNTKCGRESESNAEKCIAPSRMPFPFQNFNVIASKRFHQRLGFRSLFGDRWQEACKGNFASSSSSVLLLRLFFLSFYCFSEVRKKNHSVFTSAGSFRFKMQ